MDKKLLLFLGISALLVGSFLGNYFARRPLQAQTDTTLQAQRLIDEAGGDLTKLAKASDLLKISLSANPNDLQAYFLQGRALQQRGLIDAALDSYRQYFTAKVSIDFAANFNAGELSELQGDLANAERFFLGSMSAAPQEAAGWERLIKVLLKQNRQQEAREYFQSLQSSLPASPVVSQLAPLLGQR